MKFPLTVSNTNFINLDNAYFGLRPATINGNSEVRVKYHLVAPDPLKNPNPNIFRISDNRYWHIEFYDKNMEAGNFQFRYNASSNQPDYNLFQGYNKDDLILLYRRNAAEDWRIHPSIVTGINSGGILTTLSPLPGEYTLAMGKNPVSVYSIHADFSISIYPNPTSDYIICKTEGSDWQNYTIEIVDYTGKKIYSLHNATAMQKIDFSSFPDGVYIIKLKNATHQEYTGKVVFSR